MSTANTQIILTAEDGRCLLDLLERSSVFLGDQMARWELHTRLSSAIACKTDPQAVGLAAAEICHNGSVPANYVTMLETEIRLLREAAQAGVLPDVSTINHLRDDGGDGTIIHTVTALGQLLPSPFRKPAGRTSIGMARG